MEYYEILVEQQIDRKRLKDFDGLQLKHLPEGNTLLYGNLKDQPELFSLLNRIRDMNLKLISVQRSNSNN